MQSVLPLTQDHTERSVLDSRRSSESGALIDRMRMALAFLAL